MANLKLMRELAIKTPSKIIFFVIDGLGGLPPPGAGGGSELEAARIPHLDELASESTCGLIQHVAPGITPGSGPGHLSLFGYDPMEYDIGRGVLEALGIDFPLEEGDLAARANFCTVDDNGIIIDRRAGRLATEKNAELCALLRRISLDGVGLFVEPVREHRFVVVFRGSGLSDELTESDPQREGVPPRSVNALALQAEKAAALANRFIHEAKVALSGMSPANMVMMRGFSKRPQLPAMEDVYKLKAAAIAIYPMYRGLAKLLGMDILPTGSTLDDELQTIKDNYDRYDFFYLHFKKADAAGEDGNFEAKVHALEEVDAAILTLRELNPDVLIVTGDHSTPAVLKAHSWHPVPIIFHSPWALPDDVKVFSERACLNGGLGRLPAQDVMPLAMAHALKLAKYGA